MQYLAEKYGIFLQKTKFIRLNNLYFPKSGKNTDLKNVKIFYNNKKRIK